MNKVFLIFFDKIKLLPVLFLISITSFGVSKDDPILTSSELKILTGNIWSGNLIYKDYNSGKEVTIPAKLLIIQSDTNASDLYFTMTYPDEPHMNNTSLVKLSQDGKEFDGEFITQKKYSENGSLYFITEIKGEDNDRKADIRHIHAISNSEFIITKEVKYEGESEYFFRNRYEFTR